MWYPSHAWTQNIFRSNLKAEPNEYENGGDLKLLLKFVMKQNPRPIAILFHLNVYLIFSLQN